MSQKVILYLACAAIFEAFDVSVVNLSLPIISDSMGGTLTQMQWVQTIYLLSFGGFLILGGRLCDFAGSRNIYLVGMLLFGAASALAASTIHLIPLLLARGGQGIGAALAMPAGMSLLAKYFPEDAGRQRAFGIFGAFAAIGFASGLALGGVIASLFDWHWIFGINVPVIALVLLVGYRCIPKEEAQRSVPLNLPVACWLTATLLVLCYGIHESPHIGWWAAVTTVVSIISLLILLSYDRKQEHPFFAADIYTERTAIRAVGSSFILGATFLSYVFICTLGLFELKHFGVREAGLLLFPYSIGSALVSKFLLPVLLRKWQAIRTGFFAMASLLAGIILLMAGIWTGNILFYLFSLLLVNSICIAIAYPTFTILSLSGVPEHRQGIAAGLQSTIYSIGTGIGISFIGLFMQLFAGQGTGAALISAAILLAVLCGWSLFLLRRTGT